MVVEEVAVVVVGVFVGYSVHMWHIRLVCVGRHCREEERKKSKVGRRKDGAKTGRGGGVVEVKEAEMAVVKEGRGAFIYTAFPVAVLAELTLAPLMANPDSIGGGSKKD